MWPKATNVLGEVYIYIGLYDNIPNPPDPVFVVCFLLS